MTFPHEAVPDGSTMAPHHVYVGLALTLFGFMYVWPWYPATGATMTLVGLYVQVDDVFSHAFGLWMPLDAVWKAWIAPNLPHLIH